MAAACGVVKAGCGLRRWSKLPPAVGVAMPQALVNDPLIQQLFGAPRVGPRLTGVAGAAARLESLPARASLAHRMASRCCNATWKASVPRCSPPFK
eukprot:scaffold243516_cov32-Tisochrysis_lutea.AAC.1